MFFFINKTKYQGHKVGKCSKQNHVLNKRNSLDKNIFTLFSRIGIRINNASIHMKYVLRHIKRFSSFSRNSLYRLAKKLRLTVRNP